MSVDRCHSILKKKDFFFFSLMFPSMGMSILNNHFFWIGHELERVWRWEAEDPGSNASSVSLWTLGFQEVLQMSDTQLLEKSDITRIE